jgi:hypothetical protein
VSPILLIGSGILLIVVVGRESLIIWLNGCVWLISARRSNTSCLFSLDWLPTVSPIPIPQSASVDDGTLQPRRSSRKCSRLSSTVSCGTSSL